MGNMQYSLRRSPCFRTISFLNHSQSHLSKHQFAHLSVSHPIVLVLQRLLTSYRVTCVLHPRVLSALSPQARSLPLPASLLSLHPNQGYFKILLGLFLARELTFPWLLFLSTTVYFIPLVCGGIISISLLYRDPPPRLPHVNKTLSPATALLQFNSFSCR